MINGKIVRALDVGYGNVKFLKKDRLNHYLQNQVLSLISWHNFFI